MHVWGPKENLGCNSSDTPHGLRAHQLGWADWLVSTRDLSASLPLATTAGFLCIFWTWTQVLIYAKQAFYQPSSLSSPTCVNFIILTYRMNKIIEWRMHYSVAKLFGSLLSADRHTKTDVPQHMSGKVAWAGDGRPWGKREGKEEQLDRYWPQEWVWHAHLIGAQDEVKLCWRKKRRKPILSAAEQVLLF